MTWAVKGATGHIPPRLLSPKCSSLLVNHDSGVTFVRVNPVSGSLLYAIKAWTGRTWTVNKFGLC